MTDTTVRTDTEPELDEELLAEAMRHVDTPFRNEALNLALREYVMARRARRREALENLQRMSDEGVFNYEMLEELDR